MKFYNVRDATNACTFKFKNKKREEGYMEGNIKLAELYLGTRNAISLKQIS